MADTWTVAVTAGVTLVVAALGWIAAESVQKREWQRQQSARWDETRLRQHATYLAKSNAYFVALCSVARRMRAKPPDIDKIKSAYAPAEPLRAEWLAFKGEVDLILTPATEATTNALRDHLKKLNDQLYIALSHQDFGGIQQNQEYSDAYEAVMARYIIQVRQELGAGSISRR